MDISGPQTLTDTVLADEHLIHSSTFLLGFPKQMHGYKYSIGSFSIGFFPFITHYNADQCLMPAGATDDQCVVGLPPPDQSFRVVWNHPDTCERVKIPLHLDRYGIVFNKRRVFLGEEIQTLYRTGRWPVYSKSGEAINGGIPQLFNDTTFNKTWEDLGRYKVANFTGLGVLDFETWRAIYITNFGSMKRYKQESVKLAKRRHPELQNSMLNRVAEREWEEAARRVMSSKLAIGQTLMPGGHWGYYNYPRAWDGNSSPAQNNKIEWLWRQATGLYPSIYLTNPNQPTSSKIQRVQKAMGEAVRIQNTFSPPNTAIYAYSNLQQGNNIFFNESHLNVTVRLPADMGASGIVLWGSSSYYKQARTQCQRLQNHLRTVLGPFVKKLTQDMSDCSAALCGGNGRWSHLNVTVRLPADMGASGIVLWGSSSYYKQARTQCQRLQNHLRTVLGPFVKKLTQDMSDCSAALCGGNGRCVHNSHDSLLNEAESKRLSGQCAPRASRFRDYHCRCYSSREGACCQDRRTTRCQPEPQGTEPPQKTTPEVSLIG
ncbi:hyaluronidase conohyal-P1-like [Babylonia areolata]|uniref:hyaluronidase conohyal-P1-like n=1 Tax=Babylonia areolata TaxID=304850 RepID=UPI003FD5B323